MSTEELKKVRRIYLRLRGTRGITEDELWQHALYFAKTPDERCRISLQTARLALSSKRSRKKKFPPSDWDGRRPRQGFGHVARPQKNVASTQKAQKPPSA